jgi:hypothetical protein
MGRGKKQIGTKAKRDYDISVVYVCDAFFAVYDGVCFNLAELAIQVPTDGGSAPSECGPAKGRPLQRRLARAMVE